MRENVHGLLDVLRGLLEQLERPIERLILAMITVFMLYKAVTMLWLQH
jgi:hypothetical protein